METPQLMADIDETPNGRRVQLVRWGSSVGALVSPGEQGTATSWTTFDLGDNVKQRTLQVQWDRSRDTSLVEGMDEWIWLDNPEGE